MAVKIRCSECHKKISVDEAFAGSMCRCPYCKNIVLVPELVAAGADDISARPSSPGRSSRPSMPSASGKSARGTGLSDIAGSRPIIHGNVKTPRKVTGPAQIKTPGVPQVPGEHSNIKSVDDMRDVISSAAMGKASAGKKRPAPASKRRAQASPARKRKVSGQPANRKRSLADETEKILEAIHVDQSTLTDEQIAAVPTANRVRIQGIISLLLMALCVVGVIAIIIVLVKISSKSSDVNQQTQLQIKNQAQLQNEGSEKKENKIKDNQPGGRFAVKGPAVFAIDTSGSTGDCLADLKKITKNIISSMKGKVALAVIKENDDGETFAGSKFVDGKYYSASSATADKLIAGFNKIYPAEEGESATDIIDTVKFALKKKPKTIVLLLGAKNASEEELAEIAKLAKTNNTRLVIISLDQDDPDEFEKCVKQAGNNSVFTDTYEIEK